MHYEAYQNSMNSCQLIPTHYTYMTNIKLKRIEQMNGLRMKDMERVMNDKRAGSKFQGSDQLPRSIERR